MDTSLAAPPRPALTALALARLGNCGWRNRRLPLGDFDDSLGDVTAVSHLRTLATTSPIDRRRRDDASFPPPTQRGTIFHIWNERSKQRYSATQASTRWSQIIDAGSGRVALPVRHFPIVDNPWPTDCEAPLQTALWCADLHPLSIPLHFDSRDRMYLP